MSGLQGGIANGPSMSEQLEKDARIWEQPWTLEEMRQNSANWSLAADSGLFLFLQDFSQRMLSKTHEIEKQLDSLIRDTKATDSCLHSVFNDFLMLSNTQFIENRVYDEEVEEAIPKADAMEKQTEQAKTREQKEAELIPKMQEAVNYGLTVLESAFEHLDIKAGNSDSEDEDVTGRIEAILEPKDLYVDRPLPYLIGSKAFMEQDDIGLGDISSDEMSVDSDRDSVIQSEDGKDAVHSDEDYNPVKEEACNNIKKKSSLLSYEDDEEEEEEEEEEDEDSDIFGDSDGEDDDTKNTGPSSFADELAARIKGEPLNKPEGDRASLTSKKKSKGRKESKPKKPQAEEDNDDIFKPPEMDGDDFSPFGGKDGLFSGGRGLFDDDDEGDLFSEAPKPLASAETNLLNESLKNKSPTAESDKAGERIAAGGISVFPDNNLFTSGNDSGSVESKEIRTPTSPKRVSTGAGFGGGSGLFDEDEDDDFFTGKSLKKSDSAGQEKHKPKKAIDLFNKDEEDGDLFSAPVKNKIEVVEEQVKHSEKKMPAGAISVFGPGTKNLLNEGLRKRHLSTSEESQKSEEYGPAPDAEKDLKQSLKPPTRGLFSDDEDTAGFQAIPRSQSNTEPTSQSKTSKPPVSLFDYEEEEDLFASAAKSKQQPTPAKAATPQLSKTLSSSLFSDDEDQWLSFKSSPGKPETGGMKPSASAPSSLPSAKTPHSSLFDDDDDDLFTPKKESSQKKLQRAALLFEDEDEEKGSLFAVKPSVKTDSVASPTEVPAAAPKFSSLSEQSKEVGVPKKAAEDKPSEQEKPAAKTPELLSSSPSPESSERKKKPIGAVSLFGDIDVLAGKRTKSPPTEVDNDDDFLSKDNPDTNVKKEDKIKTKTVSLFDNGEGEESDWNIPTFTPSIPTTRNTPKPAEEQPQAKTTGVFQDEELLFSQKQQKDNDPDVDIFATSGKAMSSKLNSVKPGAKSLFADDDDDDLFNSIKPKTPPPKIADKPNKPQDGAPLASPEPLSQANLMINPAALLPGAVPNLPGAISALLGTDPSSSSGVSCSSLSPSPATTPIGVQTGFEEEGVSFDTPVQTSTLLSAHKSRAKVSAQRRPQSRAARQQAAKGSVMDEKDHLDGDNPRPNHSVSSLVLPSPDKASQAHASPTIPNSNAPISAASSSQSSFSEIAPRPFLLTLPESTNSEKKDSSKDTIGLPSSDEVDLFGPDSLFGVTSGKNIPSHRQTNKTKQPLVVSNAGEIKDKNSLPSIFDDNTEDLFQKVKPRSTTKKTKASAFLEEDNDDDDDIFGVNSPTPTSTDCKEIKNSSSFTKQNIFQNEVATVPEVNKKHKEKTNDASLFDDSIDIFADLTDTFKPKPMAKTKGETMSIFDDDMDDIFSTSTVRTVRKAPHKPTKTPASQETTTAADSSNIFDDPLNALGGN